MPHRDPRLLALGLVMLGGCGSPASSEQTLPQTSASSTAPASDAAAWLDRAATSPHNGFNPTLDLPDALVATESATFEDAVLHAPTQRRRDAASALARHPDPAALRTFWLAQLESDDEVVRFFARTSIAGLHQPEDFEPFVRSARAHPDDNTVAVRIRDFGDRRAVPVLVDLLEVGGLASENAAGSLGMLPGVPALTGEPVDPAASATHLPGGAWEAPPSTRVPAYRRWWSETGRAAFQAECAWWIALSPESRACAATNAPSP
ncbi:MAG: hypothetical protein U0353_02475 [Sandaracinus sp.]